MTCQQTNMDQMMMPALCCTCLNSYFFPLVLADTRVQQQNCRRSKSLEEVSDGEDFVATSWLVVSPEDEVDALLGWVVLHGPVSGWRFVLRDVFAPKHQFGLLRHGIVHARVLGDRLGLSVCLRVCVFVLERVNVLMCQYVRERENEGG